jgi:drug/metabolite transporter (DMT)-like permease
LLSAVLLAAWIVLGQHIRSVLPIFIYTCTSTSLHGLALAIYSVLFEGTSVWYTPANPNHSLIGWLHPDFVWQMVGFGFVIGSVGFLAYNWCIKYIDPVIFSTVQLLDPAFTALISWAAGLEGNSVQLHSED